LILSSEISYFLSQGWLENWIATLPDDVTLHLAVLSQNKVPVAAFFLGQFHVVRKRVFGSRGVVVIAAGIAEYDSL